jgi:hypothetical protein
VSNTPQIPQISWTTVQVGTQSIRVLEEAQFNSVIRNIYSQINSLAGVGQTGVVLRGPLNGGGNVVSNLTNSANPEPTEAVTFETAQNYFGMFRPGITKVTANYTVQATDGTIQADATVGPLIITLLPAASVSSKVFPVVKIDSTANTVTVAATGMDRINGQNSITLSSQWQTIRPQSNGTTYISI